MSNEQVKLLQEIEKLLEEAMNWQRVAIKDRSIGFYTGKITAFHEIQDLINQQSYDSQEQDRES